jgi:Bacterial Ig-like domain (group 3)
VSQDDDLAVGETLATGGSRVFPDTLGVCPWAQCFPRGERIVRNVQTIEGELGHTRGQSGETIPKEASDSGCRVHARARLRSRPTGLRKWRWRAALTCLLTTLIAIPAVFSNSNSAAAADLQQTAISVGASAYVSQLGQSVTFTAAVTAGGDPVTAGEVAFTDGEMLLGIIPLNSNGVASKSTSQLGVGLHSIGVRYSGTDLFAANGSSFVVSVDDPSNLRVVCSTGHACYPPPPLLNLDQGLYKATPLQTQALRMLEAQAVDDVIEVHGLSEGDTLAVQTWGRDEAQVRLYGLLMNAIDASPRDAVQQNAVDWMTAVAHRKAIHAAEAAGWEYVRWEGLNEEAFLDLLSADPTASDLKGFLDNTPRQYNVPDPAQATSGYCKYRSPAPYESAYTGYNHPTCFGPCSSPTGCLPPTPSYEQFVDWGEAAATYSFLNSEQFARTAIKYGAAALGAAAMATAIVNTVAISVLIGGAVGGALHTVFFGATASFVGTVISPYLGAVSAVGGAAFIAGVVIVALTIAITQGIALINAIELPGQLARSDHFRPHHHAGPRVGGRHLEREGEFVRVVRRGNTAAVRRRPLRQLERTAGQRGRVVVSSRDPAQRSRALSERQ